MELSGSANCLGPGVQVGEYRLQGVVGEGGFGIVYRARDLSLDRVVAVKEYMPSTLAGRMQSNRIHVRAQHKGAFDAGLRSFINEARLLAKFSHPALVHVYRFFEENGTAYMVMHYYEGQTFRDFLAAEQSSMNERWLSAMLYPILDVLEMLHAADCFHRDIAPDNVFLQESGMPVLLDFGAARRIIGDMTQALTMVLKPGFAPIEQYADDGAMPQGAWTDVYQLGAMLYLSITGKVPPTSVARMISDPIQVLTQDAYPNYSAQFLQGVHRALAVRPQDRPQSIAELRSLLGIRSQTAPTFSPWAMSGPAPLDDADAPAGNDHAAGFSSTVPGALAPEPARAPARTLHGSTISPSQRIERVQEDLLSLFNQGGRGAEAAAPAEVTVRGGYDNPRESGAARRQSTAAPFPAPPAPAEMQARPMTTIPLKAPVVVSGRLDADLGSLPRNDSEWVQTTQNIPHASVAASRNRPAADLKVQQNGAWKWGAAACAVVLVLGGLVWWMLSPGGDKANTPVVASSEADRWLVAQQAGTVAAVEAYLAEFPAGEHVPQARALLASLTPAAVQPVEPKIAPTAAPVLPAASGIAPALPGYVATVPQQPTTTPPPQTIAPVPAPPNAVAPPQPGTGGLPLAKPPTAAGLPPTDKPSQEPGRPDAPVARSETRPSPAETGKVVFRVSPWGNVRVNRSPVGTTPPLTQLELPEGQHQIEISNPAAASVTKVIHVKKGEPVVISHKFE